MSYYDFPYTGDEIKDMLESIPKKLSDLEVDACHQTVTSDEKSRWNNKSDFSGSYNDLTDKPVIPPPYQLPVASESTLGGIKVGSGLSIFNGVLSTSEAAPTWDEIQDKPEFADVATSGSYTDLSNTPSIPSALADLSDDSTHRTVTDTEKTTWNNKSDFSGNYSDLSGKPSIPTKTSDLTNDSDFVEDSSYVHTDNNYTNAEKNKLSGIASGAEANVQSDWNVTDNTSDAYIKNKPTIPEAYILPAATSSELGGIKVGTGLAISDGVLSISGSGEVVDWSDIENKPNFATVATSGDYDDLTNKPTIPVVPTNVSAFTNDAGYTTNTGTITSVKMNGSTVSSSGEADLGTVITSHQDISGKADKSEMSVTPGTGANADKTTIQLKSGTSATVLTAHQSISGKEDSTNKVTSISSSSTDTQYPSAKLLYDQLALKAPLASPTLTGTPTAPTATAGTNTTQIATTAFVADAIGALPEPMIFMGSLGTGGTITTLPTASSSNKGYTYKVITDGTYASQSARVGDTFISDGSTWVLIPSGDDPSGTGTVTSVKIQATSPILIDDDTAITTSGTKTLSHATSGVTAGTYKSVTVDTYGHVTAGSNPTTLSGYGITDAKIENDTITLGSNSITPITSHQDLSNYIQKNQTAGLLKNDGTVDTSTYLTSFTETDPIFTASAASGIQSSDITNWNKAVLTDNNQDITGTKTFVGQKKICFKQSANTDKLGFTLYTNTGTEKGYLEFNPSNTVDGAPLMTLGNYASAAAGITHIGFRKYSSVSGANGAYNLLAPLISKAKTPFSLTTTYTNFYLPLGFTDGTTTVKTADTGLVDLSSLIPSVSNYIQKSNTAGLVKNDGTIDTSTYLTSYTETDPIFSASAAAGISSTDITNWNGKTSNVGTVTGVKMNNGSAIDPDSNGVVDLGTVITSHQDISGKADKSSTVTDVTYDTTNKKIRRTINGSTADVVTAATIVTDGGGITSHQDISGKADKVSNAINGNFAGLDSNGNLTDSGKKASDFQTALSTQTAYSAKGSATKVPQITTNTLGQVTSITEVTITQPDVSNFISKSNTVGLVKNDGTIDTNTYLTSAPVTSVNGQTGAVSLNIPSAPGTLNTTATTAQSTSSSEALSGSVTLHKVAKTGTYSDLIGTPTIPTVNNSTITLNANGAQVDTFTTNASSAKTINLGNYLTSTTAGLKIEVVSALPASPNANTIYIVQ